MISIIAPSQQFIHNLLEGATESRTGEVIHQRVEDTVEVSQTHARVERQVDLFEVSALVIPYLEDPYSHTGYSAGKETGNKDQCHSQDKLNSSFDFPPFVQSLVSQLPSDPGRAEGDNYSGQEKLDDVESIVPGGEGAEAHADVETLTLCSIAIVEEVSISKKVSCSK